MAWDKTAMTSLIGTATTPTDIGTNSSQCANHDVDTTTAMIVSDIHVEVDYTTAPNADCELRVYSRDEDAPNRVGTLSMFEAALPPPTTTGLYVNEFQINVAAMGNIRVCVYNPDLTNSPDCHVAVKDGWG